MKKKWFLIPCNWYEVEKTQTWLNEMANEGWQLCYDGILFGFAQFEEINPKNIIYRLEASINPLGLFTDQGETPDDEMLEYSEISGWEFVARRGQFFIFKTNTLIKELNTDPQIQAISLKAVEKREWDTLFFSIFEFVLYIYLSSRKPLLQGIISIGTMFSLFFFILILWSLIHNLKRWYFLHRLRIQLKHGETLNTTKDWRKKAYYNQIFTCIYILSIFFCIGNFFKIYTDDVMDKNKIKLSEFNEELPFMTMYDFNKNQKFNYSNYDFTNKVYIKEDILANPVIFFSQNGSIQLDEKHTISGGFEVSYYNTIHSSLAERIAHEMIQEGKKDKHFNAVDVELPDFDTALVYSAIFPTAVLQKDTIVVKVTFYQFSNNYEVPIQDWLNLFVEETFSHKLH